MQYPYNIGIMYLNFNTLLLFDVYHRVRLPLNNGVQCDGDKIRKISHCWTTLYYIQSTVLGSRRFMTCCRLVVVLLDCWEISHFETAIKCQVVAIFVLVNLWLLKAVYIFVNEAGSRIRKIVMSHDQKLYADDKMGMTVHGAVA